MAFCLLPRHVERFKQGLKSGEISPEKLNGMTSAERRAYLSKFVGDKAAPKVNALFESKLLLANRKAGMVAWAQSLIGTPKEVRRDLVSRIEKMDERILDPKTEAEFLQDLASQKVGGEVTYAEAEKITELSGKIEEAKAKDLTVRENRIEYGNQILKLEDYLAELVPANKNIAANVLNLPRTLMSTLDLSAPLRQGWGMQSRPQFFSAFKEMFKYAVSERRYNDLMADIITRPSYDLMKSSGLRITKLTDKLSQREEAMMSSLLDKVPGIRGSTRAYTGFLNKLRADTFDALVKAAELAGEDVSRGSKPAKDIAATVNDFTGSGALPGGRAADAAVPFLNAFFFSPRKIAATVNMLRPDKFVAASPTARKAAMRQLFGAVAATAVVNGFSTMLGGETEKDPRSSDFGKVKVGDTRYDVTGGNGNYATLLARLYTGQTKSTATDLVSDLGAGFNQDTRGDVLVKWARNKLSPVASFAADWLYGENAVGEPFDVAKEAKEMAVPLGIQTMFELFRDDPKNLLLGSILSTLGVGVQTFSSDVNWNDNMGAELTQFREKVGQEKFDAANEEFNELYKAGFDKLTSTPKYEGLSNEDKAKEITNLKSKVRDEVFRKNRFHYKQKK